MVWWWTLMISRSSMKVIGQRSRSPCWKTWFFSLEKNSYLQNHLTYDHIIQYDDVNEMILLQKSHKTWLIANRFQARCCALISANVTTFEYSLAFMIIYLVTGWQPWFQDVNWHLIGQYENILRFILFFFSMILTIPKIICGSQPVLLNLWFYNDIINIMTSQTFHTYYSAYSSRESLCKKKKNQDTFRNHQDFLGTLAGGGIIEESGVLLCCPLDLCGGTFWPCWGGRQPCVSMNCNKRSFVTGFFILSHTAEK